MSCNAGPFRGENDIHHTNCWHLCVLSRVVERYMVLIADSLDLDLAVNHVECVKPLLTHTVPYDGCSFDGSSSCLSSCVVMEAAGCTRNMDPKAIVARMVFASRFRLGIYPMEFPRSHGLTGSVTPIRLIGRVGRFFHCYTIFHAFRLVPTATNPSFTLDGYKYKLGVNMESDATGVNLYFAQDQGSLYPVRYWGNATHFSVEWLLGKPRFTVFDMQADIFSFDFEELIGMLPKSNLHSDIIESETTVPYVLDLVFDCGLNHFALLNGVNQGTSLGMSRSLERVRLCFAALRSILLS